MKCRVCGTEMKVGTAIGPLREENARSIAPQKPITIDDLKMVDVWKCPNCGHSEKMYHMRDGVGVQEMSGPTGEVFKLELPNDWSRFNFYCEEHNILLSDLLIKIINQYSDYHFNRNIPEWKRTIVREHIQKMFDLVEELKNENLPQYTSESKL